MDCATTPPFPDEQAGEPLGGHDNVHKIANLSRAKPEEWISMPLRAWSISLFIIITTSLIITIIALLLVSLQNNGFVTVGAALSAYGATWRLSLLWTALPSFVFTLLGLHWAAIASAAADRQPFVGLNRPDGGLAKETVLLDYRATISLIRWFAAFRNRHWVVGWAQLASLIFSIVSPLAASLFVATSTFFNMNIPVVFNSTFDQSAMNSSMDIRVLLDSVTATVIYGAADPPWTDQEHAFRPFYIATQVAAENPPTNATVLIAPTVAHSAYLNCSVLLPGTDYEIVVESQSSSSDLSAQLTMRGNDRGCSIQQEFTVSELQSVYLVTTSVTTCSIASLYSRLVFTYGHWSAAAPSFLTDVSVVSCAVGYRKTNGDLSVTVPSSRKTDSRILGFSPTELPQDSRDDAFGFWRVFEQSLFRSSTFTVNTTWFTTDFGSVILYRAMQRQGDGAGGDDDDSVIGGDVLAKSISDVFSSIYLTGMATVGLVPIDGGRSEATAATIVTNLTRLFVVPWVAGIVIGILAFTIVVAISTLTHVRRRKTLLYEEPAGLLASAGLLQSSDLIEIARRVRNSERFDGRVVTTALEGAKKAADNGGEVELVWGRWRMSVTEGIIRPRIIIADRTFSIDEGAVNLIA
ncbi:hypothetical protein C7999DRAFT_34568 [Corynascus novoguineensis]|uniref:Uncharacterized protein n=1 Tax=Corynascus novoguineensis TaxID=1126955 RepID=A0AAN7CQK6_9PEZI|nr:hypothetical protein C7999DRAFT_34568 [Corynascus novoguineensis]